MYGFIPLPHNAMLQYVCPHTCMADMSSIGSRENMMPNTQLWSSLDISWKHKENQGDVCRQTSASKCMCVQAPVFLHSVRREEKYRFFICPGGSSSTVSTFAWSKKKSNCYLKHRPANNKGLIQPQWYLYFLVK